jgi:hypothetical protein
MFVVDNHSRYSADRTSIIDKNGAVLWVVVVKATYDIAPDGSTILAQDQIPPAIVATYNGEPGTSSLQYETDLVPPKPMTDLLVNGFAYAPEGRPSVEFNVGLELAGLRKLLAVRGDRRWRLEFGAIRASPINPVVRVPLLYERAYGGFDNLDPNPARQRMDPRNPVGCGVAAKTEHLVGLPLANFEYPGADIARAGPAGFGAIASHWQPRHDHAGTYDAAWFARRKPLLPDDFNDLYFQCAPVDQQLRGDDLPRDARLFLLNLSTRGTTSVQIPRVHLRYTTFFTKAARQPYLRHRGKLNTILVEPEHNRLTLVWSTALDCGRDIDHIEATQVTEKEAID